MKRKCFIFILLITAVIFSSLALTACNKEEESTQLSEVTNITYDGSTIRWDAVNNATRYRLVINDEAEKEVSTPSHYYNGLEKPTVSLSITAVANGYEDSKAVNASFSKLQSIDKDAIIISTDGIISWPAVEGATGYEIKIGAKSVKSASTQYSEITEGTHVVQVKPVSAGFYSFLSGAVSLTKLKTPSSISYNGSEIKWNGTPDAEGYEVIINGGEPRFTQLTSFPLEISSNLTLSIRAKGDGKKICDSNYSSQIAYTYLETPTNIRVENGIAVWDEVEGAIGYTVNVKDINSNSSSSHTVNDNSLSALSSGVNYEISVKANAENISYFFSNYSSPVPVRILASPAITWNQSIQFEDDTSRAAITWNEVSGAKGYKVVINTPNGKDEISYSEDVRGLTYAYSQGGVYSVNVIALAGAGSNDSDSKYSNTINVQRLLAPKRADNNFITSNKFNASNGFTVNIIKADGAAGYDVHKEGSLLPGTSTTLNNNQITVRNVTDGTGTQEQRISYSIKSAGTYSTKNGLPYVTLPSIDSLDFAVTVLATPSNFDISGYTVTWTQISGSTGYSVMRGGTSYTETGNQHDLSIWEAGTYQVKISALGNDAEVLSSHYTEEKTVIRLNAPYDICLDQNSQGGQLSYSGASAEAQSYRVTIDGSAEAVPVENYSNMNQYVTTTGTVIHVTAIANYWNDVNEKNTYYVSSKSGNTKTIIKLLAPTIPQTAFTASQFLWQAPANVNMSVYTPTYEIYRNTNTVYNGLKTGTAMDISYLDGGAEYSFSVKAIGDGYNFVNSEMSSSVSIYKLATPTVNIAESIRYEWNGVESASNYQIEIDGAVRQNYTHVAGNAYSYVPDFKEIKTYVVKVRALGDLANGGTLHSNAFELKQETHQLATPLIRIAYSKPQFETDGEIIVTVESAVANANGYKYLLGGTAHGNVLATQYKFNPNGTGTHKVSVVAQGGKFAEGIYYIDSQSSELKEITLLGTVDTKSIKVNEDGRVSWNAISGNSGYNIMISYDNGVSYKTVKVTNATYYNGIEWGNDFVAVKLCALGNGTSTINSAYTDMKILEYSA